jgi:hypothetical protein
MASQHSRGLPSTRPARLADRPAAFVTRNFEAIIGGPHRNLRIDSDSTDHLGLLDAAGWEARWILDETQPDALRLDLARAQARSCSSPACERWVEAWNPMRELGSRVGTK